MGYFLIFVLASAFASACWTFVLYMRAFFAVTAYFFMVFRRLHLSLKGILLPFASDFSFAIAAEREYTSAISSEKRTLSEEKIIML